MLTIDKPRPDRVDIDLTGPLDAREMHEGLNALLAASEGVTHGRMLYRIHEFETPSLGAISVELARLPQLFSLLRRFSRCAVVSDRKWIRMAAEFEGALAPGLAVKAFTMEEEEAAEAWLAAV